MGILGATQLLLYASFSATLTKRLRTVTASFDLLAAGAKELWGKECAGLRVWN